MIDVSDIITKEKNFQGIFGIFENNLFAWAIENCGFQNQKIYYGAENFPDTFPYFTVVIIRYDVTIQSLIFSGKNMDFDA